MLVVCLDGAARRAVSNGSALKCKASNSAEWAGLCQRRLFEPRNAAATLVSHAFCRRQITRRHRYQRTHVPAPSALWLVLWNALACVSHPKPIPPAPAARAVKTEAGQECMHPLSEGLQEMRRCQTLPSLRKVRHLRRMC